MLVISGQGNNCYGHKTVFCRLVLNNAKEEEELINIDKDNLGNCFLPLIPRENLLPYREYQNLSILPIGYMYKVDGVGMIKHYGTERVVLSIGDKIYQAGDDLEEKVDQLKKDCSIKIEKVRENRKRRVKFAICSIFEKGDWTGMVDYVNTKMLSKFDGSTCIVDIREVEVKGKKRKLLLTNTGDVFKLKKSRLEETVGIGYI